MPRAVDDPKQLRDGEAKIQQLGNEKQHDCLGLMAQHSDDSEGHAREVAVSVAHKHFGGVGIMFEQC